MQQQQQQQKQQKQQQKRKELAAQEEERYGKTVFRGFLYVDLIYVLLIYCFEKKKSIFGVVFLACGFWPFEAVHWFLCIGADLLIEMTRRALRVKCPRIPFPRGGPRYVRGFWLIVILP